MCRLFIAGFLDLAHPLPDVPHFLGRRVFPLAPGRQVQNVSQPEFVIEKQDGLPRRRRAAAFATTADPALHRVEAGTHAPRQQFHRLRASQLMGGDERIDDSPDLRPPPFNAPAKTNFHAALYCSTLQLSRWMSTPIDEHLQKRLLAD